MAENRHDLDHPHELDRPNVGYETTDVNAWAVGKFGIALALVCIGSLALLLGLFHYFLTAEGPMPPKVSSELSTDATKRPPAPQLEETPVIDLQRERAAEDRILNSYGWVDKQNGVVRIPIDKAIDMLAQKGLPSRATEPQTDNASVPAESGLGPVVQQPGGPLANGSGK